jgi:RTX calcium-binding nonapeptide repeat (4 copies)/BNR/Asp-box repeat
VLGTPRADNLVGTPRSDRIDGRAGNDFVDGRAAPDTLRGGRGDDRIAAQDRSVDRVTCGTGRDIVTADRGDRVAADCEIVSRRLSRDPYTLVRAQHETEVEPDSFAFDSTVVATFQVGRIANGGALNTGFATSRDGGRTWVSGLLPALTTSSRPAGTFERASDPVVAYDAEHGVWLIGSLALRPLEDAIVANRSRDGVAWSPPSTVRAASSSGPVFLDKQWIVCDNGAASRFRGRCYAAYSDFETNQLSMQFSTDGGLTWSTPVGAPDAAGRRGLEGNFAPGPQPIALPDGTVVIPFYDEDRMASIRSTDGGQTWSTAVTVARTRFVSPGGLRAGPLPVAETDGAGTIYVVWSDCTFRQLCVANDLVLSRSRDGLSWTPPLRVPAVPAGSTIDVQIPGLGVSPDGRLGLAYYTVTPTGKLDVSFIGSRNAGATWTRPQRLLAQSMAFSWTALTTLGYMVGDYISTSFAGDRFVPVFALASPPSRGRLDESIYASRLAVR